MLKRISVTLLIFISMLAPYPHASFAQEPTELEGAKYTIQASDSLSGIAATTYGNPQRYIIIVYYNNLKATDDDSLTVINNPSAVSAGWTIYLPSLAEVDAFLAGEVVIADTAAPEQAVDVIESTTLVTEDEPNDRAETELIVKPTPLSDDGVEPKPKANQLDQADAETKVRQDPLGFVSIADGEPLHLAYLLTISGETGFLGQESRAAIEMALIAFGLFRGHEIILTGADSGCNFSTSNIAARSLLADETIVAVFGPNCFVSAKATMPMIRDAGLVMISPTTTGPGLTDFEQGWQPGYFRTAHNDLLFGQIAAEFAYNELEARTAATIDDGSLYTFQLQEAFSQRFKALGGRIVFQDAVQPGDTDMRPTLRAIAARRPELVYLPIFDPEAFLVVQQASQIAEFDDIALMLADGLFDPQFGPAAETVATDVYMMGLALNSEGYQALAARYQAKMGQEPPTGFAAHAYDAVQLLLQALDQVVVEADDGTLLIGRQALRDALATTENFQGLTGLLSCSAWGDCASGEALGVYAIGDDQIRSAVNWPPPVVYIRSPAQE